MSAMSQARLVIDIDGYVLSTDEKALIAHQAVAGVILFSRNYQSVKQLVQLNQSIREIRPDLLLFVDQEGGRVQRFVSEFSHLPALGEIGRCYEQQPKQALNVAQAAGWLMASELLACGIDASLAPVLDVNNPNSRVIADRAFHAQATISSELAQAFIKGMQAAGMAATAKHFPGHGNVVADSHKELPTDTRSHQEIEKDIFVFQSLINKVAAIMPAHVVYSAFDALPASLSNFWLEQYLRQRLVFTGIIISDDLSMQAAISSFSDPLERMLMAYKAGVDLLLMCNDRASVLKVIDQVPVAKDMRLANNLKAMRGRFTMPLDMLHKTSKWQKANKLMMDFINE